MPDEIKKLPGLKEYDLAKLGPCVICRRPLLDKEKLGLTFYKLTVTRAALDRSAIERRIGLQMVLGGASELARAMGPDEDLAKVFAGPVDVLVHEVCASDFNHILELVPAWNDAE
jgi:hypothetical protein